ncbi:hypothetical protein FHG87_023876 [Trinorchestia longiramus]|nr:hypothetical protein FHG87_023876 [Trinorchestia longiramus]
MSDRSATVGSEAELGGMNNTQEEEQLDEVRCASFNQDFTSLCVGTVNGYQIYDLAKSDELQLQCHNRSGSKGQSAVSNCFIVQRLYSSSLVAVVSEDHPRKLCVNHFKKNSHICSYTYLTSILNVLLNREVCSPCLVLQLLVVVYLVVQLLVVVYLVLQLLVVVYLVLQLLVVVYLVLQLLIVLYLVLQLLIVVLCTSFYSCYLM